MWFRSHQTMKYETSIISMRFHTFYIAIAMPNVIFHVVAAGFLCESHSHTYVVSLRTLLANIVNKQCRNVRVHGFVDTKHGLTVSRASIALSI